CPYGGRMLFRSLHIARVAGGREKPGDSATSETGGGTPVYPPRYLPNTPHHSGTGGDSKRCRRTTRGFGASLMRQTGSDTPDARSSAAAPPSASPAPALP